MPTFKSDLSVSSLDSLLSELNTYKKKLEDAPTKIVSDLAEFGRDEIDRNIQGISDMDGNVLATAGEFMSGNTGFAYMKGEQAAYLEYGTGITGKSNPHPKASEVGWEYDSGKKIFTTKSGKRMWRYWDTARGHWRITSGIPAQMPVLKAARAMRLRIAQAGRNALK